MRNHCKVLLCERCDGCAITFRNVNDSSLVNSSKKTFLKPFQRLDITQVPSGHHNMGNKKHKYEYVKDFFNKSIRFRSNFIPVGTGVS